MPTTLKNLLMGGLLLASMYSAQAVSVLSGLKSGELQDAKQVIVLLQKQAAEQKSGEKELTEFLITAIKEAYTAEYQLEEAKKQRQEDLAEASKQEAAAKKWLEPNALGSTSPSNAERCRKRSEMLRGRSVRIIDEANDKLKEKLVGLQEAEDYLWEANRQEDSKILAQVIKTKAKKLKSGSGLVSFWGTRERKKQITSSPENQLMPRNSALQLKTVSGDGSFELTRRLRRKVDDTVGKEMSAWEKDKLVNDVKKACLFTLKDQENRGADMNENIVFILLEEFETLAVDGVQAMTWARILEKSPTPTYKKYGEMFVKKMLDKLSMDYHDTAQTTYHSWQNAEAGKGDAYWKFYLAYSGKEDSMIRLNCSLENAAYWLKKAKEAGHEEAVKTMSPGSASKSREKRQQYDDSSWWQESIYSLSGR